MKKNLEVTGDKLRLIRKQHGYTQKQIAESIGVPVPTYERWERGRDKAIPDTRIKEIAEFYGMSPDNFKFLLNCTLNKRMGTVNKRLIDKSESYQANRKAVIAKLSASLEDLSDAQLKTLSGLIEGMVKIKATSPDYVREYDLHSPVIRPATNVTAVNLITWLQDALSNEDESCFEDGRRWVYVTPSIIANRIGAAETSVRFVLNKYVENGVIERNTADGQNGKTPKYSINEKALEKSGLFIPATNNRREKNAKKK